MQKLAVVFGIFVVVTMYALPGETQTRARVIPRCNVGADPVDMTRQPTRGEEVINNPADQRIMYESGSGHSVECILQAGVPVVINKDTGIAVWVYGCGNNILTPWKPKHPLVAESLPGPRGLQGIPRVNGYTPQKGVDYFDGKDGRDGTDGRNGLDLRPKARKGFPWKKTLLILGGGAVAGYAGYYYSACISR